MKLRPYLKKGLNILIKDMGMLAISFLILPMAMALIYGSMQKDLFEGKSPSVKPVRVDFQYNAGSQKGAVLKGILSQSQVRQFFQEERKKADYTVTIDEGFKTVDIKGYDQGTEQFVMLKNFITTVINNFNEYDAMQNTINELNMTDSEKQNLMNNIIAAIGRNQTGLTIRERMVEGYRTLGSTEYYTISMFSFTSLIMIVTLAGYFYKEVKEGIVKRSLSTPNSRRDYFIGFLATTFIASSAIALVYVIINRIRGIAFQGNLWEIMLIVLLQSLLCTSVVGMVIAFIKKEVTAAILMNVLLILPSIFGGVFFYSELVGSKIIQGIMNSAPNSLILNSYKGLAITGSLRGIEGEIMIMGALSMILLAVSMIKVELRWEV